MFRPSAVSAANGIRMPERVVVDGRFSRMRDQCRCHVGWQSLGIIALVFAVVATTRASSERSDPAREHRHGHLMPLGHQRPAEGDVEVVTGFPDAKTFFTEYVHQNEPVIFKGAAKRIPAFTRWTDAYLKLVECTFLCLWLNHFINV